MYNLAYQVINAPPTGCRVCVLFTLEGTWSTDDSINVLLDNIIFVEVGAVMNMF